MGYLAPYVVWERKLEGVRLVDGEIWFGHLSSDAARAITEPHAFTLLECYIDPGALKAIAVENGKTAGEVLATQILPDEAATKVGDFGEILARSVILERNDHPHIPAFRWRNRAYKNDTVRGVDLLGYVMPGARPRLHDTLILCEVKTRSASTKRKIVEEALNDVRKHYVSRLTNSLYFIQAWLRMTGQNGEARKFARFTSPHENPFRMQFLPFVVHESTTWEDGFLDLLPEKFQSPADYGDGGVIEVRVMCVDNLAHWIDEIHQAAVKCTE